MTKLHLTLLLGTLYGVILVGFFINWGQSDVVIQKIFYLLGPLTALSAGGITLRKMGWQGKRALVLKYVMIALGLWFLAEITTLYMTWVNIEPYPSLADVFFLIGYGFFSASVLLEAKLFDFQWKRLDRSLLAILGTIFMLVVGIVGYFSIIGYKPEESWLTNATTISWSIGDITMGGLALILLALVGQYRKGFAKNAWIWFMAASVINLCTDIMYNLNPEAIFNGSSLTILLDALWVLGYFLFAGYFLEIYFHIQWIQSKILLEKNHTK